jgi:hypothetical protein
MIERKVVMQDLAQEKNFENHVKSFLKYTGAWYVKYW